MPKTVVIKIGTSTLKGKSGTLDLAYLKNLAQEIAALQKRGFRFVIVSSGAIVTGAEKLGKPGKIKSIPETQAAAAIGQIILMRDWEKVFSKYQITIAQVLLTRDAIENPVRRKNARNTFHQLLEFGALPIVNENDTVATEEIKVGDNDNLSALVAALIGADVLINLTNVDGFYLKAKDGSLQLVQTITKITKQIRNAAGQAATHLGIGGMQTKLQAAQICGKAGVTMVIANGRLQGIVSQILAGKKAGTTFLLQKPLRYLDN